MAFALICKDKPGHLDVRKANRDSHLGYIDTTGCVMFAGPFLEAGEMCGSLIVLDVADMEAAQAWAAGDPYAQAGLFDGVEILEWKKVIG